VRLTVLLTSPRVAPGLLTAAAWSALSAASRRLAASPDGPVPAAVAASGFAVEALPCPSAGDLLDLARAEDVVWLADAEEAAGLLTLLQAAARGREAEVSLEVLHASYDVPGAHLLDLVAVMDRLRRECPWDREQTHESLARYLLEETYETLEAIETGDRAHLREELGDLLLQVCFHARLAAESHEDGFTIDDVARGIVDKLVSRHPHVFAGAEVTGAEQVERSWELLKAAEKGRTSVLDGIPLGLPALALADKVLGRAARVGVLPDTDIGAGAGVGAGAGAHPGAGAGGRTGGGAPGGADLGHRLLELVAAARESGVDPEQALRETVRELMGTVRAAEAH
jgi:XTP/dITP diphosphohydrolase